MPLLAMISSCNMLFDSSKHCNLMLFLQSLKLLLFAIFPCVFEHVLVISGDSSVFMFCYAFSTSCPCLLLSCWDAVAYCFDACKMPSCCYGQIVVMTCIVRMCCTVAPFWVCSIWNLIDFECSFILSCCIHVLRCLLDVWVHFASMPCLTCFARIF